MNTSNAAQHLPKVVIIIFFYFPHLGDKNLLIYVHIKTKVRRPTENYNYGYVKLALLITNLYSQSQPSIPVVNELMKSLTEN